jgi:hypothetical protein
VPTISIVAAAIMAAVVVAMIAPMAATVIHHGRRGIVAVIVAG